MATPCRFDPDSGHEQIQWLALWLWRSIGFLERAAGYRLQQQRTATVEKQATFWSTQPDEDQADGEKPRARAFSIYRLGLVDFQTAWSNARNVYIAATDGVTPGATQAYLQASAHPEVFASQYDPGMKLRLQMRELLSGRMPDVDNQPDFSGDQSRKSAIKDV